MKTCPHCQMTFRYSSGLYNHIVKKHDGVADEITTLIPETVCPGCGHHNDAASHFFDENQRPKPGDTSLCLRCGHVMIFADDLTMRAPTEQEMNEISRDPEMRRLQAARSEIKFDD